MRCLFGRVSLIDLALRASPCLCCATNVPQHADFGDVSKALEQRLRQVSTAPHCLCSFVHEYPLQHTLPNTPPSSCCVRVRVQIFIDEALSPAELETMCADHDTPEAMVEVLEAKFGGAFIATGTPYVKAF